MFPILGLGNFEYRNLFCFIFYSLSTFGFMMFFVFVLLCFAFVLQKFACLNNEYNLIERKIKQKISLL